VRKYPDTTSTFSSLGEAMALDSTGNVCITGHSETPGGSWNAITTVKYSPSGSLLWANNFEGSNYGGRYGRAITIDKSGNVYVTGDANNVGTSFDFCTLKYNSNGVKQWVQYFNLANGDDEAEQIAVDNAGNVYVSGYCETGPNSDVYLISTVKYSSDGRQIWANIYSNWTPPYYDCYVQGMVVDNECNVYITGEISGNLVVIKYDSAGTQKWADTLNSGQGNAIALDKSGNVYVAGFSGGVPNTFLTAKYSNDGIAEWVRFYESNIPGYNHSVAYGIAIDSSGFLYVGGAVFHNGTVISREERGKFIEPNRTSMTSKRQITLSRSGLSDSLSPYYPRRTCVIKYTGSGDSVWVNVEDDTALYYLYLSVGASSDVYLGGTFERNSFTDYGVIQYDNNGRRKSLNVYRDSTSGEEFSDGMLIDRYEDVYFTGGFANKVLTVKFAQPNGIDNVTNVMPEKFKLYQNYPNPFNPFTIISYQLMTSSYVELKVYDVTGKTVLCIVNELQNAGKYNVSLDASNFASGVYFYQLNTDNRFSDAKKMIFLK